MKTTRRAIRRWALSTRLSIFMALIVAVSLALMTGAASYAMRTWMVHELDMSVREDLTHVKNLIENEGVIPAVKAAENIGRSFDASDKESQQTEKHGEESAPLEQSGDLAHSGQSESLPLPPSGLEGPGSHDGQLQLISTSQGIYTGLVRGFRVLTLKQPEIDVLTHVPTTGQYRTVYVGPHGYFRVAAIETSDGTRIVVGQSLDHVYGLTRTLLLIACACACVIAGVAALLGRRWVLREMKPLGAVAQIARQISHKDLSATQTIEPFERVEPTAIVKGTEVGDVSQALNAMIDNVEHAFQARTESEQRLRQFVADASHELRTPLASIQGYTQLLQRNSIDTSTALTRIGAESARMSDLVEDLLLLARLDAGRELNTEPVNIILLAIDALTDAHAASPQHQWNLNIPQGAQAEHCYVRGDEAALRQVFANLLSNARVHTPAGTIVDLSIQPEEAQGTTYFTNTPVDSDAHEQSADKGEENLVITVRDNGPGIPQHLRDTVFDRFVRADTSRTRATGKGSSGLGLSIVSSIVEALGGKVILSTVCEGEEPIADMTHGTIYTVVLPRMNYEETAEQPS
ncbi:sensor histidine kinase [Schaalia sp. lx-100]|uniref:sensor histidine kinase n=1 Tax=Schaalia sp. lx-100 TaxID=2899081 RepID=UPI001E2B75C7|nr:HAMP domain-containing sensor histidine kinase [Schaalia sp. lx-100]MCD4557292.1 HAMP domain-containing histidine kinase [Schaalia sp. lx-100]